MATVNKISSAQSISVYEIILDSEREQAVIDLTAARNAAVDWLNGGLSWTINEPNGDFEVEVEHSLMPSGYDGSQYWTPDAESPFTEPAEGNEHNRIQRIRFTNVSGQPVIVVASNANITVETS